MLLWFPLARKDYGQFPPNHVTLGKEGLDGLLLLFGRASEGDGRVGLRPIWRERSARTLERGQSFISDRRLRCRC